ncbi:hypothetical protein [Xanthobacter versatilis]|uniref:hypothetical protein n=1 Tax=Xanthobacter autotrophicus (strain ATCC BAA-1158 / Py2) TaxID=78245 RepID=UPI0037297951
MSRQEFDARYITTRMGAAGLFGLGVSVASFVHAAAFANAPAAGISLVVASICLLVVKDERRGPRP